MCTNMCQHLTPTKASNTHEVAFPWIMFTVENDSMRRYQKWPWNAKHGEENRRQNVKVVIEGTTASRRVNCIEWRIRDILQRLGLCGPFASTFYLAPKHLALPMRLI